jgi:hypothetical protein
MEKRKENSIVFHPCPAHFPDLWKQETLSKLHPTSEQIEQMKAMYFLPEDGTEDAKTLCRLWGVTSIEDIARSYARVWRCNPHGFLTLHGQLVNTYPIEDLATLRWIQRYLEEDFSKCVSRCEEFAMPEEHAGRGFASGMGHSQTVANYCRPSAKNTWPFPHSEEIQRKYSQFLIGNKNGGARSIVPWFAVEKFNL